MFWHALRTVPTLGVGRVALPVHAQLHRLIATVQAAGGPVAHGVPGHTVAVKTSRQSKGDGAEDLLREATVMAHKRLSLFLSH